MRLPDWKDLPVEARRAMVAAAADWLTDMPPAVAADLGGQCALDIYNAGREAADEAHRALAIREMI